MFRPPTPSSPASRPYLHWFLLSGNAGFVNAGAFLGVGTFATHVTGFGTLFGVNAAKGDFRSAWTALFVPLLFLLGAFIGGTLVDVRLETGKAPRYDWAMGLASASLFGVALLGSLDMLGTFGQVLALHQHPILLSLICFSSGLQNAALTTSSGRSVRISHLTGLTTDLGVGLAKVAFEERSDDERALALVRAGTIASFIFGSLVGSFAFLKLGFVTFAGPGLVCAYAAYRGHQVMELYVKGPRI